MYVLMVVPSNFPNGDAGAVRDDIYARMYRKLGYDVKLIGKGRLCANGDYCETEFISIHKDIPGLRGQITRFLLDHRKYRAVIKKFVRKYGPPSIIHINDIPSRTITYLIHLAKNYNISIVHDSVEWYSPCEFPHGKLDKAYILKDRLNRRIIRNPIKVIGISTYLTEHFQNRGLQAVRIPVIMDVKNTQVSQNRSEKVKLIYAGSPANKDYLKEIVLGTALLAEESQQRIELHVLGANEAQIKDLTNLQSLPSCITAYGRVPRDQVEEVMLGMDFSVLLRPAEERYAKAGFPTKSVEAMSHGVAMLCNISSDLGMYLKDGENAVIVDGHDEKSFARGLEQVLSLSREQIDQIKANARKLAEKEFDYRNWITTVSGLIGEK